jgi:hypothetical protein
MNMKKCNICLKPYDWYDGISDNGQYIKTNSIKFTHTLPLELDENGKPEAIEADEVDYDIDMYIDLCPECMNKLLKQVHTDSNNTVIR